jgi:hypothetical protein
MSRPDRTSATIKKKQKRVKTVKKKLAKGKKIKRAVAKKMALTEPATESEITKKPSEIVDKDAPQTVEVEI